jgi:4-hydroxy-L-threonine phosphate dehydrogenase PdxA
MSDKKTRIGITLGDPAGCGVTIAWTVCTSAAGERSAARDLLPRNSGMR